MKHTLTLIALFLSFSTFAQEVSTGKKSMSLGEQPSFSITVEGATKKMVESTWKDFMKPYAKKTKYNKKGKEFFTNDASISQVASNKVDVYMKLDEGKGQTTVSTWVDLKGEFANHETSSVQASAIEKLMEDYYVVVRKRAIEEEIKQEEKKLNKLSKDLEKLQKKNKKLHGDIEKFKEKIARAENDIAENLSAQDDATVAIKKKKSWIEKVVAKLNSVGN